MGWDFEVYGWVGGVVEMGLYDAVYMHLYCSKSRGIHGRTPKKKLTKEGKKRGGPGLERFLLFSTGGVSIFDKR